ncbi:MAG TPA: class I SAM-dependent methyltransferase [Candidatus Acidoferrales bacterium]|nr:class I SAM-dependent methyltransferase [Candidatus Acidoferrales bacterium]
MSHSQRSGGRRFDRDYGVTTHAVLFLSDLDPDTAGDAGAHATHYEAVPVADFRALLACVPAEVIPRATFVDAGAGMGRAMILAAEHPFKQVCGIEISPALYEVARENLTIARERTLRCRDIRLQHGDARIWHYPPGDLVVFLFNPFDRTALAHTLASIAARRNGARTWLLYHTPVERELLETTPGWELAHRLTCGDVFYREE